MSETNKGIHINNRPLTTQITRELAPELLRNELDSRIVKIRPSSTPLDQISRMIGARHANAMKVEYYSVDTKDGSSTVSKSSRGLEISAGKEVTLSVSKPEIFSLSETILIPAVKIPAGVYEGQALVGYVTGTDTSSVTFVPINLKEGESISDANIDTKDLVIRMGRAARELDVQTAQYVALPKKDYNYCQIFKSQVAESFYQRLADKEVGWNFTDQEEVAIMDMRMGMEKSFLFGARARVSIDDSGDEILLTGGIWNQTERTFSYSSGAMTESQLIALCREAFTGRSGSKRKILLAGSGLIQALSQLTINRTIAASETCTVWGIDFNTIVTKFGTLYVHHSEVFDLCGMEGSGMVIDPDYITKYSHVPFSAERISFRKQGVRNTEGVVLTEASCIVLRHPDSHIRVVPGE